MVEPRFLRDRGGVFSTMVSFIDFKQFQNDALLGFNPSSSSFRDFSV